jgi:acetate---CoA ligase (ADP-forming)
LSGAAHEQVSGSANAVSSHRQRLVRDVLLRDGSTLRLHASTLEDFEDIKAFYDGLSQESRYFRFHGYGRADVVARAEAEASGLDRLALIGRHDGRVVAVASYDGLRESGVAEIALAVADQFQRRGIGTRMLEQLAAIGAARAIHRFDAEVMWENRPMLGVFEGVDFAVHGRLASSPSRSISRRARR